MDVEAESLLPSASVVQWATIRVEYVIHGILNSVEAEAIKHHLLKFPDVIHVVLSHPLHRLCIWLRAHQDFDARGYGRHIKQFQRLYNIRLHSFPGQVSELRRCVNVKENQEVEVAQSLVSLEDQVMCFWHGKQKTRFLKANRRHTERASTRTMPSTRGNAIFECVARHEIIGDHPLPESNCAPLPTAPQIEAAPLLDEERSAMRKRVLPLLFTFVPFFLVMMWCICLSWSSSFYQFRQDHPGVDLLVQVLGTFPFMIHPLLRFHHCASWRSPLTITSAAFFLGYLFLLIESMISIFGDYDISGIYVYQIALGFFSFECSCIGFLTLQAWQQDGSLLAHTALRWLTYCTLVEPPTPDALTDSERRVPITYLLPGDEYKVYPEQEIGVDGIIVSGNSAILTALGKKRISVSSESVVFQGDHNTWGTLKIKAFKSFQESTFYAISWLLQRSIIKDAQTWAHGMRRHFEIGIESTMLVVLLILGFSFAFAVGNTTTLIFFMLSLIIMRPLGVYRNILQSIDTVVQNGCARNGVVLSASSTPVEQVCQLLLAGGSDKHIIMDYSLLTQLGQLEEIQISHHQIGQILDLSSQEHIANACGVGVGSEHHRVAVVFCLLKHALRTFAPQYVEALSSMVDYYQEEELDLKLVLKDHFFTPDEIAKLHLSIVCESASEELQTLRDEDCEPPNLQIKLCTLNTNSLEPDDEEKEPTVLASLSLVRSLQACTRWSLEYSRVTLTEDVALEYATSESCGKQILFLGKNVNAFTLRKTLDCLPPPMHQRALLAIDISAQASAGWCARALADCGYSLLAFAGGSSCEAAADQLRHASEMARRRKWMQRLAMTLVALSVLVVYILAIVLLIVPETMTSFFHTLWLFPLIFLCIRAIMYLLCMRFVN